MTPTPADQDLREKIEELICEHWTCMDSNSTTPECPASSPCPACQTRAAALALLPAQDAIWNECCEQIAQTVHRFIEHEADIDDQAANEMRPLPDRIRKLKRDPQ